MSRTMKSLQGKQSQSLFKRSDVQEANLAVILTLILMSTWQIVIGHRSRVNLTDPIKAVDDPHQTSTRNHRAKRGRGHLALALTIQILMMIEEREEVDEENQAKARSQKRRKRAVTIHTPKMIIAQTTTSLLLRRKAL